MPLSANTAPGEALEPLVIDSIDAARMKTMAAILQDPNPIHFDVDVVKALGMGDKPVTQGPLNMAYLIECISRFAGGPQALRRLKLRFLGNAFAGERLECTGTVTSVDAAAGVAELEVGATADGRPVLGGTAWVALGG